MTLLRPALRSIVIACVVGAVAFIGNVSFGASSIVFDECPALNATPSPTPTADPDKPPTPSPKPKPTPKPTPAGPPAAPTPTPAPTNCMPRSKDRIWGTRTVKFHLNLDSLQRTHDVTLEVLADEKSGAHDGTEPLVQANYPCGGDRPPTSFVAPWDSVGTTPYNGRYKLSVNATSYDNTVSCSDTTPMSAVRTELLVDNPPPSVGAPRIIAVTGSAVTVQWDKASVPDVIRYMVLRAVTTSKAKRPKYSDFRTAGFTTSPVFRDAQINPGIYWYSVIVTRRSVVTPSQGISSTMSLMSGSAEIKPPPPPKNGQQAPTIVRQIPLSRLALPPETKGSDVIPDAPYSAQLPYGDIPEGGSSVSSGGSTEAEPGGPVTRGPVLPVAVGAFLVSAALALSRMPY